MTEKLLLLALVAQGLAGAFDTLVNHELIARLPQKRQARTELGLHVLREANYALVFLGFAWFAWTGAWALVLGALLGAEVLITACDEYVENQTRVLPQNERVLHVLMTLNYGVILTLATPLLWTAFQGEGAVRIAGGWSAWVLTVLAAGAAFWAVRDAVAWRSMKAVGG